MALDQTHEQKNKIIKGVGCATLLIYQADKSALSKWELCSPDLSKLLTLICMKYFCNVTA